MNGSSSVCEVISGCPAVFLYQASQASDSEASWDHWETSGCVSARRASTALLCPPIRDYKERNYSLPSSLLSKEIYRMRLFSVSRGKIVSHGESIQSRRGSSQSSPDSADSSAHRRCSNPCLVQLQEVTTDLVKVLMLGAPEVGKSSLCVQFVTSEHVNTYHSVGKVQQHITPDSRHPRYPFQTTVFVKRST